MGSIVDQARAMMVVLYDDFVSRPVLEWRGLRKGDVFIMRNNAYLVERKPTKTQVRVYRLCCKSLKHRLAVDVMYDVLFDCYPARMVTRDEVAIFARLSRFILRSEK